MKRHVSILEEDPIEKFAWHKYMDISLRVSTMLGSSGSAFVLLKDLNSSIVKGGNQCGESFILK